VDDGHGGNFGYETNKPIRDIDADYFIEFIFRDTNLLTGAMQNRLDEACRIVRDITGHSEGAR